MSTKIEIFGTTDVGQVRDHNEDNFVICKNLNEKAWNFKRDEKLPLAANGAILVVADGMGGTNAGEVASHLAQEAVKHTFNNLDSLPASDSKREQVLQEIIMQAHNDIVKHQQTNLETAGMGTTLVIAWVVENKLHVGWSGDSRCYVFHGQERLLPFTDDHSLVWDMVRGGEITPEEARQHPESNIITQSLGEAGRSPKPSSKTTELYEGDKVMVCSDGLNGMLSDDQIRYYLGQKKQVADICKDLTDAANQAGGTDNITTLLLEVLEGNPRSVAAGAVAGSADTAGNAAPHERTATQVLRSRNQAKNYLLLAAGLVVVALLTWILFFMDSGNSGGKTVINVNGKTFEYTSGTTHHLDLVSFITGSALAIDSFSLEGLDYRQNGDNGRISFTISGQEERKVHVRLYPATSDSVYVAQLTFRAGDVPTHREEPARPGQRRPGSEVVLPQQENPAEQEAAPGDTTLEDLQEEPPANEIPVEEEMPHSGEDTTAQPASPEGQDTTAAAPAPPPLNQISKEVPDTSAKQ